MLSGQSLRFSSRLDFNDPFDCRPYFQVDSSKDAKRKLHETLRAHKVSPAKRLGIVNSLTNSGKDFIKFEATHTHLDKTGVLCLTPYWDSALMWSHYADHHKGICVGFHSDTDVFISANKVVYADELPTVTTPVTLNRKFYDNVFLTKAKCWEYEQEWRVIKSNMKEVDRDDQFREFCCHTSVEQARSLSDQKGPGNYNFSKSSIESICLGMRISKHNEKLVLESIEKASLKIKVYKILNPSTTYELTRSPIR
jgi:endoglucanase Acf2